MKGKYLTNFLFNEGNAESHKGLIAKSLKKGIRKECFRVAHREKTFPVVADIYRTRAIYPFL